MVSNEHGEAPSAAITRRARRDRSTDELIGLCRGILADGVISEVEARFLMEWLYQHREFRASFPFNVLYGRVDTALSDGIFDLEEQRDLLESVHAVIGGEHYGAEIASLSTWAPFDNPQPVIRFPRSDFVLTGRFVAGPKFKIESFIAREGGYVRANLTSDTRYLVVGTIGSRDWKHSAFGRKIERALEMRADDEAEISIVSEEHLLGQLTPL
ncbi:MAG: hypothetical protein J0I96_01830 [Rhodanobacter sp.]|nr:hypothetical protein [Rhodanobacter sp.]